MVGLGKGTEAGLEARLAVEADERSRSSAPRDQIRPGAAAAGATDEGDGRRCGRGRLAAAASRSTRPREARDVGDQGDQEEEDHRGGRQRGGSGTGRRRARPGGSAPATAGGRVPAPRGSAGRWRGRGRNGPARRREGTPSGAGKGRRPRRWKCPGPGRRRGGIGPERSSWCRAGKRAGSGPEIPGPAPGPRAGKGPSPARPAGGAPGPARPPGSSAGSASWSARRPGCSRAGGRTSGGPFRGACGPGRAGT